jgi:hypothetical protein
VNWRIQVPFRSRDDALSDVAEAAVPSRLTRPALCGRSCSPGQDGRRAARLALADGARDMREDDDGMTITTETPESRLYAAGFTRQLEWWVSPDGSRVMNTADAIAGLDSGEIKPGGATVSLPDSGIRALPDELVERILHPPPPPPPEWLESLANLVAEKLKPVVCAEVRAGLLSKGGKS